MTYDSTFAYYLLKKPHPKVVILKDNAQIDSVFSSLNFFKHFFNIKINIVKFYSYEIPPVSSIPPSHKIMSNRIRAIHSIINETKNLFILTNINAVFQPMMSEENFFDKFMAFGINTQISMKKTVQVLDSMYYTKKDFLENFGDYAKRGDIIDIFSPLYDKPLRIEFFGDEIDSIRQFYTANQRTFKTMESAEILPAMEFKTTEDSYGYMNFKKEASFTFLFDYDNIKGLPVVVNFDDNYKKEIEESLEVYKKSYGFDIYFDKNRLDKILLTASHFESTYDLEPVFADNIPVDEKIEKIKELSKNNRVVIACASNLRAEKVGGFLQHKGVSFQETLKDENGVYLSVLYLKNGFYDKKKRLAVISFEDMFGQVLQHHRKKVSSKTKTFVKDCKVVHKTYGIGIYRGIKKLNIDNEMQDFLEIEFEKKDKLFVPVYYSDSVFEYHGNAPLSSLNSNKWKSSKENIKRSIKKILTELINTYAKRQLIKREPFEVDTLEYREFEAMFEYEETKDQAKAIEDIKNDMQKPTPADRLICGDVSFGKTEVAMRACAISVFNARQVVFMAPTTILSVQHYKTFVDRFAQFPVNIALLNRFTTKKEKEKIFDGLKKGLIDILISTHSVYSDKIEFANLGLVIIDEEQRFGVKIKEHLKSKYPHIDMIYLSATPIPRTLNMAMNGIFDISVIKTPPLERKPIETFVLKRKTSVIRDAVLKELSRKGSVYFVHNRIETIEQVKNELDNLLPFARKSVVHSKMPNKIIKRTIEEFNEGKFDILISTSIIESGMNIKNVNTIIIDAAENFGLADLYQLRGRVGRGDKTAYAYLLVAKNVSEDAKKRLYFMKEFVERGIGFNLALKDMEIRGGGNILGKDQSGSIRSVGFETYSALIEEAIGEMRNMPKERDVEIKCSYKAYIDDNFANEEDKFAIYKMIYAAKTEEELEDVKKEISDTFGKLPSEVENLFFIAVLKIYAKKAFVKNLSLSKRGVLIEFYIDADIDTDKLIKVVEKAGGRFVSETSLFFENREEKFEDIYRTLKNILQSIA